ncbi:MAG: phage holin family protein [Mycobacteriales bacterium]
MPADASFGELVKDASAQLSTLVRGEIELAKAEITREAKRAGLAVALFAVAGALVLYALTFGLIGLAEGLVALGLWRWLSYLIVFVLLVLIAGVAVLIGMRWIKRVGKPERTIASVKGTASAMNRARKSK